MSQRTRYHRPKPKPKMYIHRCECCQQEFISTREVAQYKPGHFPRKANGYEKGSRTETAPSCPPQRPLITVQQALQRKPASCSKCQSTVFYDAGIDEMLRMDSGYGVGWRCVICGNQIFALKPGESLAPLEVLDS